MSYIPDTSAQDTKIVSKKPTWKKWLLLGSVIAAGYFVAPNVYGWFNNERAIDVNQLKLATVKQGQFVRDISVQGKVVAAKRPTLYSPSSGTVTYLVKAGDTVVIDQPIAIIDSPELTSELTQQQAERDRLFSSLEREKINAKQQALDHENKIGRAEVALNAAKREMRRAQEGHEKQVVSDIDYQKAKDDLQNAEREYTLTLKAVELLKESLKFEVKNRELEFNRQNVFVEELQRQVNALEIKSPVAGLVGNLTVQEKTNVEKNQPLLSVVDLTQYEIEVQIPEQYGDDLALGMAAEINLNSQMLSGELIAISPEIVKGTIASKIRLSGEYTISLKQNQRLTSRIILEQKDNVRYLPRGQFMQNSAGQYIYKVANGVATRTPIRLGSESLSQIEVLSGLLPGDTVVVSDLRVFNDAEQARIVE
ncbi:efflux RND transporter periplasmic adaptor subunit [Pseudoalteromonas xiamenensis]